MDATFALRVGIAFVVGGLAVATFTTIAERRGSRLGGLLLSFPVKVVVSLLLIGLNEGAAFAAEAAGAVPLGIGVNVVFLAATALLARRASPEMALAGGIACWLVAGVLAVTLAPQTAAFGILAWLAIAVLSLVLLDRLPGVRGDRRSKRDPGKFGVPALLVRAAAAGSVVAASVLLARVGGPLIGGLASVFPSGWLTTMLLLVRRHGPEFTAATVRVMVAGSAAPALFGVACALLIAPLGVVLGLLAGLGVAGAASGSVAWALAVRDAPPPAENAEAAAGSAISGAPRIARR